jgi:hypothetical protein
MSALGHKRTFCEVRPGSDGRKNRRLVALAAGSRVVVRTALEGALTRCSLGDLKRIALSSVSIKPCSSG